MRNFDLWIFFLKKYIMYLTGMRETNHENDNGTRY